MSASMSRSSDRLRSPGEGPRQARPTTPGDHDMTLQRMDNVLIVVEDLEAAKAFFAELGMELEGEATNEGPWVDSTVGLNGVRADLAMMRTPDGHGRVELTKFHTPPAVRAEPESTASARRPRSPGTPRAAAPRGPGAAADRPRSATARQKAAAKRREAVGVIR